jgi:pimeloyl-ACP methyl ester carboxylesterase
MKKSKRRAPAAMAELRRMYIDCRSGQMHLTTAYPPSGGFDERTPLVCLHADGGTGADFSRLAALLGIDRSVYAPDLPGSGASDLRESRATLAGHAGAIADLIDQLRLKQVDLVGLGRGAAIAFQLAADRPEVVRRLVVAAEPDMATSKAVLQLDAGIAALEAGAVEAVVESIRAFLDRA